MVGSYVVSQKDNALMDKNKKKPAGCHSHINCYFGLMPEYRFTQYFEKELDYDTDGNIVGIDIDNASRKLNLKELVLNRMPIDKQIIAA
jgi:hypothetical protein